MIDALHAMADLQPDYAAFLAQHLPAQTAQLACYALGDSHVWLWRAGALGHPVQRRLLALVARLSHTPALRLPPAADVATQRQGLQALDAHGLRAAQVLASHDGGLLLRDPGSGSCTPATLEAALHTAGSDSADALLALWRQGLALIDAAHAAGLSLRGALASDLRVCADQGLACTGVDGAGANPLPIELRQVRDALGYLWSTAGCLHLAGQREAARPLWDAWVTSPVRGDAFRATLAQHLSRLSWLRYLPPDSRWGSATYQMRAAYEQATRPRYGETPASNPL